MVENNKKHLWKKIVAILIPLLFGIGIGIAIGISIGKGKATEETRKHQDVVSDEAEQPTATSVPQPTEIVTPTGISKITATPELTKVPVLTTAPSLTPPLTTEATKAPTEGATPEPTAVPTVTSVPEPTTAPTGTVTPKPKKTPTPAPTRRPGATPTPIPVASGTDGYFGPLHVEGTYLADAKGNLVQLRGISTHGLGWFPEYVNEAAIRQFKREWGCNVFRLAMYTAEYNGYCTSDAAQKENLKKIIDRGVKAATAENMYVIIDWHILQDKDPNVYKSEAIKFFDEMSKKYAKYPNVIYEICNEPNSGATWDKIKAYALEVIPVIRKNAPEAVIIVGTPTWSQDVDIAAKDPITGYDNLMYALHFYADTHRDDLRNKCTKAVQMGLPLFVTEYGTCAASGDGYVNVKEADQWIALLDGYGISHVAWNLSNKGESSSMISAGCNKKNGFTESDLSTGGKWFVNMLQKAGVGIGAALSGTTDAGQGDDSGDTGSGSSSNPDYIAYGAGIISFGDGLYVTVCNGWKSENGLGIQLDITILNETAKEENGWERRINVKDGVTVKLGQNWNSTVEIKGNTIIIRPTDYNGRIPAGGNVSDVGIILNVTE